MIILKFIEKSLLIIFFSFLGLQFKTLTLLTCIRAEFVTMCLHISLLKVGMHVHFLKSVIQIYSKLAGLDTSQIPKKIAGKKT